MLFEQGCKQGDNGVFDGATTVNGKKFSIHMSSTLAPPDQGARTDREFVFAQMSYERAPAGPWNSESVYPEYAAAFYTNNYKNYGSASFAWQRTGPKWAITEFHATLEQNRLSKDHWAGTIPGGSWPTEFPQAIQLDLVNCVPKAPVTPAPVTPAPVTPAP
jgi:hypothetical protein